MESLTLSTERPECTRLAVLHSHPRDAVITFEEERHIYFLYGDSTDIVSCTTFIHGFFRPFIEAETAEHCARKLYPPDSEYYGKTPAEIRELWRLARELGTEMHYQIERHLNSEPYLANCKELHMFHEFERHHPHLVIWRTEMRIWDAELRICGSIDAIYEDVLNPGYFYIADWKRTNDIRFEGYCRYQRTVTGGRDHRAGCTAFGPVPETADLQDCNFIHYCLQLNLYRYILEKNYGMKFNGQCLVVLHPRQETYLKLEAEFMPEYITRLVAARLNSRQATTFSSSK